MLQIVKLGLHLWKSNIIWGIGSPYGIGLAFDKTVSILKNTTKHKSKGYREFCLKGAILSELNWSEIKALLLEKKAMIYKSSQGLSFSWPCV